MNKVKIISNPYEKKIDFRWFDGDWKKLPETSELLNERFTNGFFPFCAEKIVEIILNKFRAGTEIVFEGTDDEYNDLKTICSDEKYKSIILRRGKKLYNARDILKDVTEKFEKYIQPLIDESVKDEKAVEVINGARSKFADVSKEIIPICVMSGNYSSGKSTFINALIGAEILPSADKPLTARIHKIERSDDETKAEISFEYCERPVKITFSEDKTPLISGFESDEFIKCLNDSITANENEPIAKRVYAILKHFTNENLSNSISDNISEMIVISFPFNNKWEFGISRNKFVIFDTPGANSASNKKHEEVLKKALEDLSNGLPIFITQKDQLDSKDNEQFADFIKGVKRLDDRFTMIVVNKADGTTFEDQQEDSIFDQAIPKHLYRGGLYYISSIVGLGAKIGGDNFISGNYEEIFDDTKQKFSNPSFKHFKELYKHNIIPAQIKRICIEESESVAESESERDRLYANSGLFWIEKEIETFAKRYAPYNKCSQSKLFLDEVIDLTSAEIEKTKKDYEFSYATLNGNFEDNERKLTKKLDKKIAELQEKALKEYDEALSQYKEALKTRITEDWLSEKENALSDDKKKMKNNSVRHDAPNVDLDEEAAEFDDESEFETEQSTSFASHIFNKAKDVFGQAVERTKENIREGIQNKNEQRAFYDRGATAIVDEANNVYNEDVDAAQHLMVDWSIKHWREETEKIKRELVGEIAGSDDITKESKDKLIDAIMSFSYGCLGESKSDKVFKWQKFKRNPLSRDSRFDTKRFAKKAQSEFKNALKVFYSYLSKDDKQKFADWVCDLRDEIIRKIAKFNPEMERLWRSIKSTERTISDLQKRHDDLYLYNNEIKEMMAWYDDEEDSHE